MLTRGLFALLLAATAASAQLSISGKIVDITGTRVYWAEVTASHKDAPDIRYSTHTNSSGEFEIKGIEAGSYKLRIICPGFRATEVTMQVSPEHPHDELKSIVLQIGSVADPCAYCGDDVERHPENEFAKVPRGCEFLLDTREVLCELQIGKVEPVEPPERPGPALAFSSIAGKAYLVPRNGAEVSVGQPCATAVYSVKPVPVDQPGLTNTVCVSSSAGNCWGTASPTLLKIAPPAL